MPVDLRARFKTLGNFPSPPGIAQEIVALAKDPETEISAVARTIAKDPALAAKVLRTANSPLYAQRRRSDNLRQALLAIGVEGALTMCLSFSIAGTFRKSKSATLDFPRYWRRSLLAALGSRCFGEELTSHSADDLFLAGLLQDIGVIALDRANPGFYADLPAGATHAERIAYERERLGEDHAALGAWLLGSWNFPDTLCTAVSLSHASEATPITMPDGLFIRCVAAGGELATAFLAEDRRGALEIFCRRVGGLLGARTDQVGRVLDRVMSLTADVGPLFDTTLLSAEDAVALLEEAQELLVVRNVESLHEIHELQRTTQSLADRSVRLEDATRRDALTGVFNRGHLDARLQAEFEAARSGGWPLGALFIDLDHFKKVNDTHGHAAGDEVLRAAARILREAVREQDLLARYGGEEFVVLLPGIAPVDARRFAERILAGLRAHEHRCGEHRFRVTASLGFAVDTTAAPFAGPAELIAAADAAVYAAKRAGRNRMVVHGERSDSQSALTG